MNKKIVIGMISIAAAALLGACGNGNTKDTSTNSNDQATSSSQVVSSANESSLSTASTSSLLDQEFKVSLDEAIQLYSKEHPDAAITSIEFDKRLGAYGYKIEGVDDSKEYELFIDADTKKMSKQREERLDSEDANGVAKKNDALLLDNIISPQEAMEAAFSEASNQGDITEWKLNQEIQKTFYEVTVKNRLNETEIKIDSVNGTVLQTERD